MQWQAEHRFDQLVTAPDDLLVCFDRFWRNRTALSTVLMANTGAIVVDAARRFRSLGWTVIGLDGGSAPAIAAVVDRLVPLTGAGGERLTWSASEDRDSVLRAIRACSPDAVFTGFGTLSEDPKFAQQIHADGRTWLGADPQILIVTQNKPATLERA